MKTVNQQIVMILILFLFGRLGQRMVGKNPNWFKGCEIEVNPNQIVFKMMNKNCSNNLNLAALISSIDKINE